MVSLPIKTALIGCGKVGHTHAQALISLPQSDFVAVCSRDARRAADFAAQYGVEPYTDLRSMLLESKARMVSVCTPHPAHPAAIITAAINGVNVLAEKPLAPDLGDCDRAIVACRDNSVKLGVISQRRLYQPILRMRQAIEGGKIGSPVLASLVVLGWRGEEYYQMDAWRGKWDTEGGACQFGGEL